MRASSYGVSSWKAGLPWLYYTEKPLDIVKKSNRIDLTVSYFQPSKVTADRTSTITFMMARYALNGTFLGFETLRDQMNLCPLKFDDVINMMRFGAVTESECEFELAKLTGITEESLPNEANYFFELYIMDRNEFLLDVPVAIRNFRKGNKLINTDSISNSW